MITPWTCTCDFCSFSLRVVSLIHGIVTKILVRCPGGDCPGVPVGALMPGQWEWIWTLSLQPFEYSASLENCDSVRISGSTLHCAEWFSAMQLG